MKECHSSFESGSFFDHDGLPFCERHFHALRGSLCASCNKPITGRCMTAMYRKYHPEHFICVFCLQPLNKGTFKEQDDRPYCHQCFDKLFRWAPDVPRKPKTLLKNDGSKVVDADIYNFCFKKWIWTIKNWDIFISKIGSKPSNIQFSYRAKFLSVLSCWMPYKAMQYKALFCAIKLLLSCRLFQSEFVWPMWIGLWFDFLATI